MGREQEQRIELTTAPDRLVVITHRELPRDPSRPHFVQTEPIEHVYVKERDQ